MEEDGSRTFKLQRSQSSLSWLACRSKSSRLLQDSLSPYDRAFVALPGYERLSKSMRLFSEEPRQAERVRRRRLPPQQGGWIKKVIGQVFYIGKVGGDREKEKKKKRSSWLPDPERWWPVQGW